MMRKRVLRIIAFVTAVLLIAFVCFFANSLVGNPISRSIATKTAERHLNENYSDKDFVIENVTYSFKDGYYYAGISSPTSIDSSFSLVIRYDGELVRDYYEDYVLSGMNTANRIWLEYKNAVDAVFNSQLFPYNEHIGYGDIKFVSREYLDDQSIPANSIIMEDLVLDEFYDVNELGAKSGSLTVYLYDNIVSHERLAEIILDVKQIFDNAGVKFYSLDFVLEYPKSEDHSQKDGRVEAMNFLYSDIYEDGMVERVKASDEAAKAYYAEQDAKR